MTIIVGIQHEGRVLLAGDRQYNEECGHKSNGPSKIRRVGNLTVGVTGDAPSFLALTDSMADNPDSIVDIQRALFEATSNGQEPVLPSALVVYNQTLYKLMPDGELFVEECGYSTVGSGADYARGALYVLSHQYGGLSTCLPHNAELAARLAIEAACACCVTCGGPTDVVWVD